MNLQPLFETQKKLMDRIGYNEPDRFEKTITALLVELAELANEVRFFKYWSTNQKPTNKVLEEYVDGLHFGLQFGLELTGGIITLDTHVEMINGYNTYYGEEETMEETFKSCFIYAAGLYEDDYYYPFMYHYLRLGSLLGFTWEQIEQAYMDKNKVNHERQNNGY